MVFKTLCILLHLIIKKNNFIQFVTILKNKVIFTYNLLYTQLQEIDS